MTNYNNHASTSKTQISTATAFTTKTSAQPALSLTFGSHLGFHQASQAERVSNGALEPKELAGKAIQMDWVQIPCRPQNR
jgi:hypothetical protein